MQLEIPVFIDDRTTPVGLIFQSNKDNLIEINLKLDDIEIPVRRTIFNRLSIYQSVATKLSQIPDVLARSNPWESFRPPTTVEGVIQFNPPATPIRSQSAHGLEGELMEILSLMTIIPDPEV